MKQFLLLVLLTFSLFGNMQKFLMPNEAFIPDAKVNKFMQIEAKIALGKGIYIYDEQLKMELKDSEGVSILNIKKPKTTVHDKDKVYMSSPSFLISLKNDKKENSIRDIKFIIHYQGCSSDGLCYEPQDKTFNLKIDTSKFSSNSNKNKTISETDTIVNTIVSGNIFLIILTFFGFGLLLSLTPCIFPMIPIISGLIISQGEGLTTKKAFFLSLVYVLAMSIAYTIAGVLAGLFGSNLQATLQNPFVIYAFSGIFVALAMSMFGFYELKLPDAIVNKVSSNKNKSGYIGIAIMGFLSALIVGPCVAAPLAGALIYIGHTGDALLGGIALFSMGIGMGVPLILVGVSAGKFMPRPGEWMTMVSVSFGIIMLGVAIWMLDKVVDSYITILLFSLLGIGSAIYFGVFEVGVKVFRKTFSVILFIYSISVFMSVLANDASLSTPLKFLTTKATQGEVTTTSKLNFIVVKSISELDDLLNKNKGKKVLLDFSAKWCSACRELEEITFSDKAVQEKMNEFVLIRADVTDNTDEQKALSKKYEIFGPPALLFFDVDSKLQADKTIIGFIEPKEFLTHTRDL